MRLFTYSCFAMLLLASPAVRTAPAEELPPGLVAEQPAEGPFVKTERGFMVPYSVKLPGSAVEFTMQPIPGGKLKVGSPEMEQGRKPNEGPQFEVEIAPFWMARCEVTWAEYKEYMKLYAVFKKFVVQEKRPVTDENNNFAITAPTELYEPSFTFELGEDPRQPAATMTQFAAKQYTKWLSGVFGEFYRLPSEAEWEYACRAGSEGAYGFGNDPAELEAYGWFAENSEETTHPVGEKKPNAFGLHDMHGNVAEWVLDEVLAEGYAKFEGKPQTAAEAIVWPTKLFPRAIKGGFWDSKAAECRCAARMKSDDYEWKEEDPNFPLSPWWFTSYPSQGVGFRIIRPLDPPPAEEREKFWEADVDEIREDVKNRLDEGRGVLGVADPSLPAAAAELNK